MIHIVTHANRYLYADELLQAHRQRREAFVEQRGWPLSVREDGGEYDEGDDERAIYFLAIDKAGQVEASMRARPTDDFCVVADVFPHFLADGPASAKAPDVWEIARWVAVGRTRGPEGFNRRGELRLTVIEQALACGVRKIVGMTDLYLLGPAMRSGWRVKPIGIPADYGQGQGVAVEVEVSEGAVVELRERLALDRSPRLHIQPGHPLQALPKPEIEAFAETYDQSASDISHFLRTVVRRVAEIETAEGEEAAVRLLADALDIVRASSRLDA